MTFQPAAPFPCQTTPSEDAELPQRLVSALYRLLRDHVQPGELELACMNAASRGPISFTNPHLERYAKALATYLLDGEKCVHPMVQPRRPITDNPQA